MTRRFWMGLVLAVACGLSTTQAFAVDLTGEFTAEFTIGDETGTATWTAVKAMGLLPRYDFTTDTGATWTALALGDFVIWQVEAGLNPIYFGSVTGFDESGVLSFEGSIFVLGTGSDAGTWSATKLVSLSALEGTIDEAGSALK